MAVFPEAPFPGQSFIAYEDDGTQTLWVFNGYSWMWDPVYLSPPGPTGPTGPAGSNGLNGVGWSGSFYDTTDQTGNAGVVLTMSLNNSDPWNNGVSVVSGTQITLANPGVYNLAFSAQLVKSSGNSSTHTHIWLSQNGTDVPYSASQIGFPSNNVYDIAAWNFFFETTTANEYVELKWQIESNVNNGLFIKTEGATGNVPGIPGLIVTVNQVG